MRGTVRSSGLLPKRFAVGSADGDHGGGKGLPRSLQSRIQDLRRAPSFLRTGLARSNQECASGFVTFIESMIETELEEALSRPRYGRLASEGPTGLSGHRHGHRSRSLVGKFWPSGD